MRSRLRVLFAVASVLALAVVVAACGGNGGGSDNGGGSSSAGKTAPKVPFNDKLESGVPSSYPKPSPRPLTIGYSSPNEDVEDLVVLAQTIQDEAGRLGGKVLVRQANNDVNKQVSDLEQLIAQKVDALIVFPLDPKAVLPEFARARKAGIPVLAIDMNLGDAKDAGGATSQVWRRRDRQAYLLVQHMAQLHPQGKIALIGFAVPVPSITFFLQRVRFWAGRFGLSVQGQVDNKTDDLSGGAQAMTAILGRFPDISGVIAYNDESAVGAYTSARQAGKRDLTLMGANGASAAYAAIRAGRETASAQQPIVSTGQLLVQGAYDAAEGKKIPPTVLADDPVLLTKQTVDSSPTWQQQLKKIYGK